MSVEENIADVRRAVDAFGRASLDEYMKLYAPDCVMHFIPPGLPAGVEGARLLYGAFLNAFPDAPRLSIDDVFGVGDRLACRFTTRGTHAGDFVGVPATGRTIEVTGITILRFRDGRCVERWSESNLAAVRQRLAADLGKATGGA